MDTDFQPPAKAPGAPVKPRGLTILAREVTDLRDPAWLTHPREQARRLRTRGRVHRDTQGLWLLIDHADCRRAMQSSQLSRDPRRSTGYPAQRPFGAGSALEQAAERFMLFNDAETHARMRRAVSAAFTPAATRSMRGTVEAAAQRLLADLRDSEPFEFMARFAQVLPIRVICDMLGIDGGNFEQAKAWSDAAASVVEPLASRGERTRGADAVAALGDFLRTQVARRRADPGDGVLDRMIATQRDDPRFDDDELMANLVLLFIAGHETTTNLLGNGLLALLDHPEQLDRLRRDPTLLPGAVEEMLRYDSPVNMVARTTVQPWDLGGVTVPPGEVLYCMIGAANHDPAVFDDPDRFDIGRRANPQLSFGGGVHYCIGAPLARLEAEVAFDALLRRFPVLARADDHVEWRPMINLRGLRSLRVRTA